MASIVDQIMFPLSSAQKDAAKTIEREFVAAGFSHEVAAAAIANAYQESRLNPKADARSHGEYSLGLFQLNMTRGAGKTCGLNDALAFDPAVNTRCIIREAKAASGFMALVKAGERDVPKLAAAFSTYVERPLLKSAEETKRAGIAAMLWPSGALSAGFVAIRGAAKTWIWITVIGGVGLAGLIGWDLYRRRRRSSTRRAMALEAAP